MITTPTTPNIQNESYDIEDNQPKGNPVLENTGSVHEQESSSLGMRSMEMY